MVLARALLAAIAPAFVVSLTKTVILARSMPALELTVPSWTPP